MALSRIINFHDAHNPTVQLRSTCIVDTGAGASLANHELFGKFKMNENAEKLKLTGAFGGDKACPVGKVSVGVDVDGVLRTFVIHLVKDPNFSIILGNPTIKFLRITINHEGIFTPEGRLFGVKAENTVNFLKINDLGLKVFNVNVSKISQMGAIRLDEGVFQRVSSGPVTTSGQFPEIIEDFLEVDDLPYLPSSYKPDNKKKSEEIKSFFEQNKFEMDESISDEVRRRTVGLLQKFKDCIAVDELDMGSIPRVHAEFRQEFTEDQPSPCPLYRIAPHRRKIICAEIAKLLKLGVAKRFKTEVITTSLITVKKSDNSLRVVSDLRFINGKTKPCNLRLPRLDEILESLVGFEYYHGWDIKKGYWHIKIAKDQYKWFTFQCPDCFETYCWVYCPMGGKNSGSVFSHAVQSLIIGDLRDVCFNYIDDSYAPFNKINDGLNVLETVLKRLVAYNMKLGIKKIRLFNKRINAFGFEVDKSGRKPNESRVLALRNSETPTDKKRLLSGLASINYYRTHIRNFAAKSAELYRLTGEKETYDQEAVNRLWPTLRDALCEVILLTRADYSLPFVIQTDACDMGVAGLLIQIDKGERKIISTFSKKLNKSQALWSISSKELFAIKLALEYFEHIISDVNITIETDCAAVYWLLKLRTGEIEVGNKLPALRSLFYISTFSYNVVLVGGQDPLFLLADYLSRNNYRLGEDSHFVMGKTSKDVLLKVKAIMGNSEEYCNVPVYKLTEEKGTVSDSGNLEKLTDRFKVGTNVTQILEMVKLAQLESKFCRSKLNDPGSKFRVKEGTLYSKTTKGDLLTVPRFYAEKIVKIIHENDHSSPRRLVNAINEIGILVPGKYRHIVNVVQGCNKCNPAQNVKKGLTGSRSIGKPIGPFDIVSIDLTAIGDIPILCVVDNFSHFVILRALKGSTSKHIKDELISVFCLFGLPMCILSDNAMNLNSVELKEFYSLFGIQLSNSSVLNSTGNFLAEYSIKRFSDQSKIYGLELGDLDYLNLQLSVIAYKLNLQKREGREHITAFEAMFSRYNPWIFQLPDLSATRAFTLKKGLKFLYEETLRIRNQIEAMIHRKRDKLGEIKPISHDFKVGQKVRIRNLPGKGYRKKLFRPWTDNIWKVIEKIPFTNCVLVKEIVVDSGFQPRKRRVHVKFLKKVSAVRVAADDQDFEFLEPGTSGQENEPKLTENNGQKTVKKIEGSEDGSKNGVGDENRSLTTKSSVETLAKGKKQKTANMQFKRAPHHQMKLRTRGTKPNKE